MVQPRLILIAIWFYMFESRIETIEPDRIIKYEVMVNGSPLTFADVIKLWEFSCEFRTFYSSLLANSPFLAFRWETPALSLATAIRPFEFVLLNSPEFYTRSTDSGTFASYFTNDETDFGIVKFDSLGGDSTMVVPSPRGSDSVYGHFAAFIRGAPSSQVDAIWRVIGNSSVSRLSEKPFWISTAGGGVAWLHVRLDSRPKYYGYRRYKQTE